MKFLEFTFQSHWHFIGIAILLNGFAYFTVNGIIRIWRSWLRARMVLKHGWPPEHLDADGDWKPENKIN